MKPSKELIGTLLFFAKSNALFTTKFGVNKPLFKRGESKLCHKKEFSLEIASS